MNWKTLYRFAAEEPIQDFFVEVRIWLAFKILPKPIRSLAIQLLETTASLLSEQKSNKNLSINISVSSENDK